MKKLLTAIAIILLWAGLAWGAGVHYSGLTSTNNRCSFTSSYAWLDWSGKDFSAYAGGRWEVRLTDSSGYQAVGYVGSVGTGETLGVNPFATFDFTSGWGKKTETTINDANTFTAGGTTNWVMKNSVLTLGALYKSSCTAVFSNGTFVVQDSSQTNSMADSSGVEKYQTVLLSGTTNLLIYNANSIIGATVDVTSLSVKQVLTPSAAGVYILNGPTGSTGWASIHSSFSYNAITDIQITPAASLSGVSVSGVGINN